LALAALTLLTVPVSAQQVGENINVLPLVPNSIPDYQLKGDWYLQRQLEPTICASTRNPNNLIAFFNDYRAVDEPDDPFLGETYMLAMALKAMSTMMAAAFGPVIPTIDPPPPVAVAEAWVGMSRSYDGGLTWSGGWLPGAGFDGSDASTASPVWGLEAATDPVVVCGPCGKAYVIFVAFTRGGESKIAVARYEDLNNVEGGDTWIYLGTTVLESGNNAEYGYFLDKPDLAVDVFREFSEEECAQRVYASYSTFNGLTKDGKFQSKINFAKSEDYGVTFTTQKINPPYQQNQGSALAIDPRPGLPTDAEGGGTIYMFWRHFFSPDAILMTKSTNFGDKWSKVVEVTGDLAMAPFDQPTIPIDAFGSPPALNAADWVSFRSNGFPTATVDSFGRIFAAWQERVDIVEPVAKSVDGGYGRPVSDAGGSPRIVLVSSGDAGATWYDVEGNLGDRKAVDFGPREKPFNAGLPYTLGESELSGPQVMPRLSFAAGNLMLVYTESRGLVDVGMQPPGFRDGAEDVDYGVDLTYPLGPGFPGYISG
jgi:hypothetical protein